MLRDTLLALLAKLTPQSPETYLRLYNNLEARLQASISASQTQLHYEPISSGWPAHLAAWEYFVVTASDSQGRYEIMTVKAVGSQVLHVERGKEGTLAQAWDAADTILSVRLTAGILEKMGRVDEVNRFRRTQSFEQGVVVHDAARVAGRLEFGEDEEPGTTVDAAEGQFRIAGTLPVNIQSPSLNLNGLEWPDAPATLEGQTLVIEGQKVVGRPSSFYLGAFSAPPMPGFASPPLVPGMTYYNLVSLRMMTWNGLDWVANQGLVPAVESHLTYRTVAGQTLYPLTTPDVFGNIKPLSEVPPQERVSVFLEGLKLAQDDGTGLGQYTLDYATSTLTLLEDPGDDSRLQMDVLVPPERMARGAISTFAVLDLDIDWTDPDLPSGMLDGERQVFDLWYIDPQTGNREAIVSTNAPEFEVYVDGVRQRPGVSYTIADGQMTFAQAPREDSVLWAVWNRSGTDEGLVVPLTWSEDPVLVGGPPWLSGNTVFVQALAQGAGGVTYTYQWMRNGSAIPGATGVSRLLNEFDAGNTLSVLVRASDGVNAPITAVSNLIDVEPIQAQPVAVGDFPDITGDAGDIDYVLDVSPYFTGDDLTFSVSGDAGSSIVGSTLTVTRNTARTTTLTVTASSPHGPDAFHTASITIQATASSPTFTSGPSISGTPEVGQTLTVSATAEGDGAITYAYQWTRDGANIAGATAATYLLQADDDGSDIGCDVVATDGITGLSTEASAAPVSVTYSRAVAAGALDDREYAQGSGVQTVDASVDFTGAAGGTWSVTGTGASINQNGVVSITTDAVRTDSPVVVTYTNSGGATQSAFSVTVQEAVVSQTLVAGDDWVEQTESTTQTIDFAALAPSPGLSLAGAPTARRGTIANVDLNAMTADYTAPVLDSHQVDRISFEVTDGATTIGAAVHVAVKADAVEYPASLLGWGWTEDLDSGTDADLIVAPDGDDATADGTLASPYATLDAAIAAWITANGFTSCVIAMRGGFYRRKMDVGAFKGILDQWLTIKRYGNERPVVTGADPVAGWAATDASDAAFLGSAKAESGLIYKTVVNAADFETDSITSLGVTEDGTELYLAQDRYDMTGAEIVGWKDKFWDGANSDTQYNLDASGLILSVTSEVFTKYTRDQLLGARITVYRTGNFTSTTDIVDYDPATRTATLADQSNPAYGDAARRKFALSNIGANMSRGTWASTDNGDGTWTVYCWPQNAANLAANMEFRARSHGILAEYCSNIVFAGIEVHSLSSRPASGAEAVGVPIGCDHQSTPWLRNIRIWNCRFRHTGSMVIANGRDVTIQNCTFEDIWSFGVGAYGTNYRVVTDRCHFVRCSSAAVRYYGAFQSRFTHSLVEDSGQSAHANTANAYQEGNGWLCYGVVTRRCGGYVTWQENSDPMFGFSDLDSNNQNGRALVDQSEPDSPPNNIMPIDSPSTVRAWNLQLRPSIGLLNDANSLSMSSGGMYSWPHPDGFHFVNSVLHGGGVNENYSGTLGAPETRRRNLYTGTAFWNAGNYGWSLEFEEILSDLATTYVDAASEGFVHAPGSLARTAQTDDLFDLLDLVQPHAEEFDEFDMDAYGNVIDPADPPMGALEFRGSQAIPGRVAAPTVTPISTTEDQVAWTAPSARGATIASYELRYHDGHESADWTVVEGVTSPHNVAGLTDGAPREYQIRAVGADGRKGLWGRTGYSENTGAPEVLEVLGQGFDTAATTFDVNLPATVNYGEWLIVVFGICSGNAGFFTPDGWHYARGLSSNFSTMRVYMRRCDGTEGGSFVTVTSDTAAAGVAQVLRLTGTPGEVVSHGGDTKVYEGTTSEITTSGSGADITPDRGEDDYLWMQLMVMGDDDQPITEWPADWTPLPNVLSGAVAVSGDNFGVATTGAYRRGRASTMPAGTFAFADVETGIIYPIAIHSAWANRAHLDGAVASLVTGSAARGTVYSNNGAGTMYAGVWPAGVVVTEEQALTGEGAVFYTSAPAQMGANVFNATGLASGTAYRWAFAQRNRFMSVPLRSDSFTTLMGTGDSSPVYAVDLDTEVYMGSGAYILTSELITLAADEKLVMVATGRVEHQSANLDQAPNIPILTWEISDPAEGLTKLEVAELYEAYAHAYTLDNPTAGESSVIVYSPMGDPANNPDNSPELKRWMSIYSHAIRHKGVISQSGFDDGSGSAFHIQAADIPEGSHLFILASTQGGSAEFLSAPDEVTSLYGAGNEIRTEDATNTQRAHYSRFDKIDDIQSGSVDLTYTLSAAMGAAVWFIVSPN